MIRQRTVSIALIALAALQGRATYAQSHPVEVWLRSGIFQPSDGTLADVYQGARFPVIAQGEVRVLRSVALFGGLRYATMSGHAVPEGGAAAGSANGATQEAATSLTTTSVRAGALLVLEKGRRWDFRLGAGVTATRYTETWSQAAVDSVSGTKAGWLVEAAVTRRLGRHWFLGGSVEYSGTHVAAAGDDGTFEANLGGLDLLAGVGFRF